MKLACYLLYFYCERIFVFFIKLFFSKHPDHYDVMILKLDGLGDYILFRNFLTELTSSEHFKKKSILFVGNSAWREIAESFDNHLINKTIWLSRAEFRLQEFRIRSRLKTIKNLSRYQVDILICPTYTRISSVDSLAAHINARIKIAQNGFTTPYLKPITDAYYDLLSPTQHGVLFEFERNRQFFEWLLNKKLYTKLRITPKINTEFQDLYKNYVVLFINASTAWREWPIENFCELAKWIYKIYGFKSLFCGTNQNDFCTNQIQSIPLSVNLVGKTNLKELLDILEGAKFVVSNETSVPHMCVAMGIPVFTIYNGNSFGEFIPYPKHLATEYYPIYHPYISADLKKYEQDSNKYPYHSQLNIRAVTVQKVIHTIKDNFIHINAQGF